MVNELEHILGSYGFSEGQMDSFVAAFNKQKQHRVFQPIRDSQIRDLSQPIGDFLI